MGALGTGLGVFICFFKDLADDGLDVLDEVLDRLFVRKTGVGAAEDDGVWLIWLAWGVTVDTDGVGKVIGVEYRSVRDFTIDSVGVRRTFSVGVA